MANEKYEVRAITDGGWCWLPKAIIREYALQVRPLGIAVYAVLAAHTDSSQQCYPSQGYIADYLGYSRSSINRALKLLANHRLIQIDKKHGRCSYQLLKARSSANVNGVSHRGNLDVPTVDTNDNTLEKNYKNDTIDRNFQNFTPQTRDELLARDLAEGLDDAKGLRLYLSYAKKYPEPFLRGILSRIKEMPPAKIKKSRGALFTYLVKRYGTKHS